VHVSAVERAGIRGLAEVVADQTGKTSAVSLRTI
jgi:hypothetical protein